MLIEIFGEKPLDCQALRRITEKDKEQQEMPPPTSNLQRVKSF